MKRHLLVFLSLLALLTGCGTFDLSPSHVTYNDLVLSSAGEAVTLPGSAILSAKLLVDPTGDDRYKIAIVLNGDGTNLFTHVTERAVGKQLLVSAAGKTILSATIMAPIPDGRLTVTGYTRQEANRIFDSMVKKTAGAP